MVSPKLTAAVAMTAIALLALPAASATAPAQDPRPAFPFGVWRNPKDTVHVEVRHCGPAACGYVIWANEKAEADAREGGTDRLVGQQLFQNLEPVAGRQWQGEIFVPDLGVVLPGTIDESPDGALVASGCLMANVACKSQSWTRIASAQGRSGRSN